MTNREYLTIYLGGMGISDGEIEIMMLESSTDPNNTAEPEKCKRAIYDRMSIILKAVTGNRTEGGYAVKWNMEAVKMFYSALCMEMGYENKLGGGPSTIEDMSAYW